MVTVTISRAAYLKGWDGVKVLFLTWEFPPFIEGGLGMACYGMVRGLLAQGIEVALLIPAERPCIIEMKRKEHIDLLPCRMWDELAGKWRKTDAHGILQRQVQESTGDAILSQNSYALSDAAPRWFRERLENVISLVDFDVIHAHDWMTFEAGLHARGISGKPLVCHVHSTEYDRACGRGNEHIHAYERIGLVMADRVVTVSQFTADTLQQHYGTPPDRIQVIHNAYHLEKSTSGPHRFFNEPVVLFMGRMTCQKGPDIFLEITRSVLSHYGDVRFVMAGRGDLLYNLIHRAAYYGMKNNLLFTGFLNRAHVHAMLSISDIFVAPSVSDPFNITVLEAMSSGLSVLVSRQSGVTEVVRHVLTADYWDVDAISRIILSLLRNPERCRTLAEKGRAEAQRLSWECVAAELIEVYRELL
jgi:glycosyltransferase involved in cell wall biosynthesis